MWLCLPLLMFLVIATTWTRHFRFLHWSKFDSMAQKVNQIVYKSLNKWTKRISSQQALWCHEFDNGVRHEIEHGTALTEAMEDALDASYIVEGCPQSLKRKMKKKNELETCKRLLWEHIGQARSRTTSACDPGGKGTWQERFLFHSLWWLPLFCVGPHWFDNNNGLLFQTRRFDFGTILVTNTSVDGTDGRSLAVYRATFDSNFSNAKVGTSTWWWGEIFLMEEYFYTP